MTSKIKKLDVNFEKSVLETYERTLGDTLRDKIVDINELNDTVILKCVRANQMASKIKNIRPTF